jgi:manganese/iron transport system permease protein
VAVYLGLLISYQFNTAAGSTIVLTSTLIFFIIFAIQNLRARPAPRAEAAHQ